MPLDTLKIGIYELKDFMNCIKVKRNRLLNSIYSSVSKDFRFKETPYVNFYTDPELSSSLYVIIVVKLLNCFVAMGRNVKKHLQATHFNKFIFSVTFYMHVKLYLTVYHIYGSRLKDARSVSFRSELFTSYI